MRKIQITEKGLLDILNKELHKRAGLENYGCFQ